MPPFGRSMLEHWRLDPGCTYLNHGTVGAPPARVLDKQQALRDEMERHPSRFMLRELNLQLPAPWRAESRFRAAMKPVAAFLGARADDIVFVHNVTTGLNAVLQSVALEPGDEVVVTDLAYGAIALAARAAVEARGATLRLVDIPHPVRSPGEVVDAVVRALSGRTRVAVIDHVTSQTALILPVAEIASECQRRGVPVLVDGAHAPGSIPVAISELGVDWYAANLHKWAHAPRSCGVLWARPDRQATLHHPVVSWGFGRGFHAEFEHNATIDPTSCLTAPEGIALLQEWDFNAVLTYMHGLAWDAAGMLGDRWGTNVEAPKPMIGAMVAVPLPVVAGTTPEDANQLRLALLLSDQIEVQLHAWRDRLWARVSAQVYNDRDDIERLGSAVCRHIGYP